MGENKRKTQDFQKKQRQERKKLFEASGGAQGFGMSGLEDQLRQLEGEYSDSEEEDEEVEEEKEEDLEDLDELYCVACDKLCKSLAAKENHETSKKHKENMAKLIEDLKVKMKTKMRKKWKKKRRRRKCDVKSAMRILNPKMQKVNTHLPKSIEKILSNKKEEQ